ncbi:MAG: hypothetical protein IIA44_12965, partial [Acidobacteria bacterium]|nr:hypothetical protein [Acidobacteriota bacterium]
NVEETSGGIWKIEAWIANEGFLPYPTHQGERSERPRPATVTITGDAMTLLEGRERNTLSLLAGSGGTDKVTWLVQAPAGQRLTITAHSFSAGGEKRTVTLTEGGGQ